MIGTARAGCLSHVNSRNRRESPSVSHTRGRRAASLSAHGVRPGVLGGARDPEGALKASRRTGPQPNLASSLRSASCRWFRWQPALGCQSRNTGLRARPCCRPSTRPCRQRYSRYCSQRFTSCCPIPRSTGAILSWAHLSQLCCSWWRIADRKYLGRSAPN